MNRRELMLSASAVAAATILPRAAFADPNRIDWITSSDQNVIDFWTNIVKPKFEAANAGLTITVWGERVIEYSQHVTKRAEP